MPFDVLEPVARANTSRVTLRDVQSRTLKSSSSRVTVVGDTTTQLFGPFTLTAAGGGTDVWNLIITTNHSYDPKIKVAIAPFKILFFLNGYAENNVVPFGSAVNFNWFEIHGPFAVPAFKIGGQDLYGSDGYNTVHLVAVQNLDAAPHTLYGALQVRAFSGTGAE